MEEKIAARIAELEAERAAFTIQANATLHAFHASIAELQKLIVAQTVEPKTEYVESVTGGHA